jgi:ATP diphosphatase
MEALQMTTKVARVGFDWPDAAAVMAKVDEELGELRDAAREPGGPRVQEELGDLLFALVNLARHHGVDPESALKAANRKFRRRFAHVEAGLRAEGRGPADATLGEMDALWEDAKARERTEG